MLDATEARRRLDAAGQGHVLNFFDRLDPEARRRLLAQVESLDLGALPGLVDEYVRRTPVFSLPEGVRPAPYYPRDPASRVRPWPEPTYRAAGEALVRAGKVACFTVAGGQGSRLGFDGPKGCFPGGAVTGKPLFQLFAEGILAARRRYAAAVPWYIMTSPQNHAPTRAFFEAHRFFGLDPGDVMFFPQGVMPSLDIRTGRILLAGPGEIATNPDGHGGSIKALWVSGAIADMKRRGVEHISCFQVDNPIVRVIDPVFLGLHAAAPDSSAEMSSKMIPKAYPEERLGVFCAVPREHPPHPPAAPAPSPSKGEGVCGEGSCREGSWGEGSREQGSKGEGSMGAGGSPRTRGGAAPPASSGSAGVRIEVIEYSDLPADLQRERLPDGTLRFLAGSIAVHVLGVAFVERLNTDAGFRLPFHRAEKKVPCIDPRTGEPIAPAANNAVKLERFVFDALPLCRASIVYETDRVEEFAPIKNAEGTDSPQTSRRIQTLRAARWLEACGVRVPRTPPGATPPPMPGISEPEPDCTIEISPLTATSAEELRASGRAAPIPRGASVVL